MNRRASLSMSCTKNTNSLILSHRKKMIFNLSCYLHDTAIQFIKKYLSWFVIFVFTKAIISKKAWPKKADGHIKIDKYKRTELLLIIIKLLHSLQCTWLLRNYHAKFYIDRTILTCLNLLSGLSEMEGQINPKC